jgi:non-specific serine/threonine protein kinase
LTSLIDRERELAQVKSLLLDRQVRLVTLTGAPGTGKSRLAVALGGAVASRFPDGVWFVPLGSLSRADLVMPTLADALGVRQLGRRPVVEALKYVLRSQRALLILDNFEQVLPAAAEVVELLTACAELAVLVTSRAPLRVSGEHLFAVPPLELPDPAEHLEPHDIARVASVRLFVERAQAARPGFLLTESNAAAVAELCLRLDGLPLAIELAAARCGPLEPWDLLRKLGGSIALLADGPRDLPPRQRTLRSAIDWSYELLSSDQQRVFRRLAVFAGGCSLDAVRAVVSIDDERMDEFACVAALLDQSLLVKSSDGPRVALLETVREYGLERLASSDELERIRAQHADYYLTLGEGVAAPRLEEPDGPLLMDQLEREHDNLRAALRWLIDHRRADESVGLAGALWSFWDKRGHRTEALNWLSLALALPGSGLPAARARALIGCAMMHRGRSEFALAVPVAREAVALMRDSGDRLTLAAGMTMLADMLALGGDPTEAIELAAAAAALREGNPHARARSLLAWGYIAAYHADFGCAAELFRAGLELRRGQSGSEIDAILLLGLGTMLAGSGDLVTAQPMLEQALAGCRARGEARGTPRVLLSLGALLVQRGDVAHGRVLLTESLALFRQEGESLTVVLCSLLLGEPLPGSLRAEVGESALAMAWRASIGREAPPAHDVEAWCIARDLVSPVLADGDESGRLTRREIEILQLLARRYSNREIAEQLVLSIRTVERHINNLFTKTGLTSRRAALEYCERHGLLPRR